MTEQQKLLAIAEGYHELGLPVIPFFINPQADANGIHEKTPVITTYKKWYTEPQTKDQFKALDWRGCNGFGVILGIKATNGYYLSCIDHDTKNSFKKPEEREAYEKAIPIGKEILKKFPQATKIEKTVNDGIHLYYWSKQRPETDGNFHDTAALELLGYMKLCVMYPSYGYKDVGSDVIATVENLDELFHKCLKGSGFGVTEETEVENQVDNYSFQISKIIDLSKLENKGEGQYQGSHPIHDSTTEHNFSVDTKHNQWFCFRHNSGGGALQYLAVKEGLIKCEQAKRGALRGKKFQEVLKIAVASGLIDEKVLTQSEINPVILAKDIMEDHVFAVDKETNELYFYVDYGKDEGIYSNQTEQLIKREIVARLDENFKARYYNEINEFILGSAPLVEMGALNPELLAVQNGLLDVLKKSLEKYTSKSYITKKLPVIFDQENKSTVWHDFIKTVIPNEKQRKQVQQLIGHCLYRKILTEICLILLGGGSNGKTIFLLTITKFLGGSANVSSHSIQALCYDKFVTGEVRGKLANICADLPHKELLNTANFKALTSGDQVQAYIKHVQKTIPFFPTTKYIFSANQIPPVSNEEDCYAWYRRFIFADFSVTFTKENSVPRQELLDKLSSPDVFSEILNWALEGLETLNKEGDVTDKPTVAEIRLQYIKRSDSALAYFEDRVKCTSDSTDYVFTDQWFRDYVNYCLANNLKPKTQGDFINTVKQHLPGAEKTRIRPERSSDEKTSALSAFRYVKIINSKEGGLA
ncbi:MAG: phage/plasmid primase, P4 family [Candidatus Bathyarchaeia archaeon]|jgi:putative DNA primase/helicase